MNAQNVKPTTTQKGGINKALAGCAIVAGVALVGVVGYLVGHKPEEAGAETARDTIESNERRAVVTTDNVDDIIEEMANREIVPPGYYTVTQTSTWNFATGTSESDNAYVENDPENTNDVYFDVFLAEDETNAIYESPIIPRGAALEHVTLKEDLDPGTYDCVLIYHLVDEDQNTVDTLRVTLTVIIEG